KQAFLLAHVPHEQPGAPWLHGLQGSRDREHGDAAGTIVICAVGDGVPRHAVLNADVVVVRAEGHVGFVEPRIAAAHDADHVVCDEWLLSDIDSSDETTSR